MSDASAFSLGLLGLVALLLTGAALPLAAQGPEVRPVEPTELSLQAYTLRHQTAGDAVDLLSPFLSNRGSIELQPISNTLVIRDEPGSIARIMPVLRSFDHPRRPVRVEVRIVRASVEPNNVASQARAGAPQLSQVLTRRLKELLRFRHYDLVASANLTSFEGDPVVYQVGSDYELGLRLGTVLATRRIKLHEFRLSRADEEGAWQPLIHTNLELTLGDPMVLGLAPAESSDQALMLVMTCREESRAQGKMRAE